MATITLRADEHLEIIINLVSAEIAHMAQIKAEFREKEIDCGGVNTQIDRLKTILRDLTAQE